jgi:hypothetical protein
MRLMHDPPMNVCDQFLHSDNDQSKVERGFISIELTSKWSEHIKLFHELII